MQAAGCRLLDLEEQAGSRRVGQGVGQGGIVMRGMWHNLIPGAWYTHDDYPGRMVQVRVREDNTVGGVLYDACGDGWKPLRGMYLTASDARRMRFAWK